MSYAVIVLLPNGRRQNIKITPNYSILQVLEQVCSKQGLNPEEYDLKHYNRILDLSAPVRFSNIPNNAQLELVQTSRNRVESVVNLGIQLESGERLLGEFLPTTTLWEVINHWELIRALIFSSVVENDLIPVCVYMRNEIAGEEALTKTTLRSLGLLGGKAMIRLSFRPSNSLKKQAFVEVPLPRIRKLSEDQDDVRPSSSKPSAQKAGPFSDVLRNLPSEQTPMSNPASISPPQKESEEIQATTSGQINKEKVSGNSRVSKRPAEKGQKLSPGKNRAYKREKEKKPLEEKLVELGERRAILFSLDSVRANTREELPDEFFNLTLDDLKYLFADLQKKRKELEDMPLQTRILREAEIQQKMEKYKETVIRIIFPDRLVLQGLFVTTEQVSDVMEFVRKYITSEIKDFYLFTTPPKRVLQPNEQLFQASLVPKAIVYFGGTSGPDHPLREDIRKQLSTHSAANRAASQIRQQIDDVSVCT